MADVGRLTARLPAPVSDRVWGTVLQWRMKQGGWTLVPQDDLRRVYREAVRQLGGEVQAYAEFGIYAGDSLGIMADVLAEAGSSAPMFGFDSFRGLPDSVTDDEGGWQPGAFYCPEWVTRWNLSTNHGVGPDRITLIPGWFDESLTPGLAGELGIERISIAQLDADAYSSTVPVLDWLTPLLADRAVLIFDDWFAGGNTEEIGIGVQRAFEEWLERRPEFTAEAFATYGFGPGAGRKEVVGKAFIVSRTPA